MKNYTITQKTFNNWDIKDLWSHYQFLQLNLTKRNSQILKMVIKEIKGRK